jgi:hypothetical protein
MWLDPLQQAEREVEGGFFQSLQRSRGEVAGLYDPESQSSDPFDRADDFGNLPGETPGGWQRPKMLPPFGLPEAPTPLPIEPELRPETAKPVPTTPENLIPPVEGGFDLPDFSIPGFKIPEISPDLLIPVLPWAGAAGMGAEEVKKAVPAIAGLAGLLPIILIMAITKD